MTTSHGRPARFVLTLSALLGLAACGGAPPTAPPAGPAPEPAGAEQIGDAPDVAPVAKPAPTGLLGTARYDLPLQANAWVEAELNFLTGQRRAVIGRWLQRGELYGPWVQDVFASHGIPRDLHHLAMVESGYQPTARSRVGALGMWQFMPATGREMGLRVDALVDERMDPVRSTHAAARHLRDLHRTFRGDWALAAAAYNAGTGRINRSLNRFGVSSYWDLIQVGDLASETKHYVPRLMAVTIIGRDPARFGYAPASGPVRRFAFDSVRVDVETPLAELARIGSLSVDELRSLNPHLVTGIAPANYVVWVPSGAGQATQLAFVASDFRREGGYGRYAVRRGDELGKLAELSGLTVERIRELNPAVDPASLRSGQRLVLPSAAARTLAARPVERVAAREDEKKEEDGEERPSRSSRRRESTSAERSEGSTRERGTRERSAAREMESGEASARERRTAERTTREGSSRTSRSERTADAERSSSDRSSSERASASRTATRASESEKGETTSASRGSSVSRTASRERTTAGESRRAAGREHTVDAGETLWAIARQYNVSVEAVKEANDLGDGAIQPGQKLRIPGAASSAAAPEERRPASRSASTERRTDSRAASPESRRSTASDEPRSESRAASAERRSESRTASSERRTGAGAAEERKGEASAAATRSRTQASRAAARFEEHVVKDGETLWSISRRYQTTVDSIVDANAIRQGQSIQPGQKLRIPAERADR